MDYDMLNIQKEVTNKRGVDYIQASDKKDMDYVEMLELISKVWIDADDIMRLAQCGKHSATNIRNEIEEQIIASGKKVPTGARKCVPTKLVLEYLGLDIDFICSMAERLA